MTLIFLALEFGCTEFVNPTDYKDRDFKDVIIEMTDGGCDYTFECVGNVNIMVRTFYLFVLVTFFRTNKIYELVYLNFKICTCTKLISMSI